MKRRLVNIFVMAIATMALAPPHSAASQDAGIMGCVFDTMGQRIPGARIVARAGAVRRTTETNAAGCYELKGLPPASYRITTRLAGFDNVTNDRVMLAAAAVAQVDFTIRLSAICECIDVGARSLADTWKYADAVLHVTLSDADPDQPTPSRYYRHVATVLADLKPLPAGRSRAGRLFVLQNQSSGAPEPYGIGQELLVFLVSHRSDTFGIMDENPGMSFGGDDTPAMAFLIQDGRIQHAPSDFSSYVGLPVDVLLSELRALARPAR